MKRKHLAAMSMPGYLEIDPRGDGLLDSSWAVIKEDRGFITVVSGKSSDHRRYIPWMNRARDS